MRRLDEGHVTSIFISADGRGLLTASEDKTARLWDLMATKPGQSSKAIRGHKGRLLSVEISPDTACRIVVECCWSSR